MSSSSTTGSINRYSGLHVVMPPLNELKPFCLERPAVKMTLFVISFLLAGGSLASHFTGLGTIAVASLGAGGGLVFTPAIALTLSSRCKEKKQVEIIKLMEVLGAHSNTGSDECTVPNPIPRGEEYNIRARTPPPTPPESDEEPSN